MNRKAERNVWKAFMWMSLLGFVSIGACAVYLQDFKLIMDAIPFAAYASLTYVILRKDKQDLKGNMVGAFITMTLCNALDQLKRYEEKYGKLPEEEKKEEESKEESNG